MSTRPERIEAAIDTLGESASVDFKERFDPASTRDWCETIKDVVAMANTGGGCLIFGVRDDGTPSEWDPQPVLSLDPAKITDKIARYTAHQFADFAISADMRAGAAVAVLIVDAAPVPMVFTNPGTYPAEDGKQRSAFTQGTVYFRHGAKSEPAATEDLAAVIERRLADERDHLLASVRKVFAAPSGHNVLLVRDPTASADGATSVRVTSDPDAPAVRVARLDDTYPFRQKEVIKEVNRRLSDHPKVNAHDLLCVRRVHNIDESKPEFVEVRRYGSAQYTSQFVAWLLDQVEADSGFFEKARFRFAEMRQARDVAHP